MTRNSYLIICNNMNWNSTLFVDLRETNNSSLSLWSRTKQNNKETSTSHFFVVIKDVSVTLLWSFLFCFYVKTAAWNKILLLRLACTCSLYVYMKSAAAATAWYLNAMPLLYIHNRLPQFLCFGSINAAILCVLAVYRCYTLMCIKYVG